MYMNALDPLKSPRPVYMNALQVKRQDSVQGSKSGPESTHILFAVSVTVSPVRLPEQVVRERHH